MSHGQAFRLLFVMFIVGLCIGTACEHPKHHHPHVVPVGVDYDPEPVYYPAPVYHQTPVVQHNTTINHVTTIQKPQPRPLVRFLVPSRPKVRAYRLAPSTPRLSPSRSYSRRR